MRGLQTLALAAALMLAGCAHDARTAPAATVFACAPELAPEPAWPDTDAALRAAPDLFERVRLLAAGRLLRIARGREVEAALAACR